MGKGYSKCYGARVEYVLHANSTFVIILLCLSSYSYNIITWKLFCSSSINKHDLPLDYCGIQEKIDGDKLNDGESTRQSLWQS